MRRLLLIFLVFGFAACKEGNSSFYTGNFYIRAPLLENYDTYMDPGVSYDGLYILYNAAGRKKLWKIMPLNDNEYNIAPADNTTLLITADSNRGWLAAKSADLANNQKLKIIPSAENPLRVAIQSPLTGNYFQLDYCYKDGETWGYSITMEDPSNCDYQDINAGNLADTCYCLHQFVLKRN